MEEEILEQIRRLAGTKRKPAAKRSVKDDGSEGYILF